MRTAVLAILTFFNLGAGVLTAFLLSQIATDTRELWTQRAYAEVGLVLAIAVGCATLQIWVAGLLLQAWGTL